MRQLCFSCHRVDHFQSGVTDQTGIVVKDHGLTLVRKDVLQPLLSQVEITISGVPIEAGPVRRGVQTETGHRPPFTGDSTTQLGL